MKRTEEKQTINAPGFNPEHLDAADLLDLLTTEWDELQKLRGRARTEMKHRYNAAVKVLTKKRGFQQLAYIK